MVSTAADSDSDGAQDDDDRHLPSISGLSGVKLRLSNGSAPDRTAFGARRLNAAQSTKALKSLQSISKR